MQAKQITLLKSVITKYKREILSNKKSHFKLYKQVIDAYKKSWTYANRLRKTQKTN